MDIDVFDTRKPVFASLIREYGDYAFSEYLDSQLPKDLTETEQRKEFVAYFESFLATWISAEKIPAIIESLKKTWAVNTSDHNGIPWDPFFANENFMHARYMHTKGISTAIVLACSGTSMGNDSLPRGIGFHDTTNMLRHAYFFPAETRGMPVYGAPPVQKTVFKKLADSMYVQKNILKRFLEEWMRDTRIEQADSFSKQLVQMMQLVWNHVPTDQFARLAYLPLEELVVYILINLPQKHPIWDLIEHRTEEYLSAVAGIQGAHTKDLSHGSMMFWHRAFSGERKQLIWNNGIFETTDSTWNIHSTRTDLIKALQSGSLYPTIGLSLLLLSAYFGITCMGGFSQIGYLKDLHQAWHELYPDAELPNPSVFCCDYIVTTLPNGSYATLIDIMTHRNYEAVIKATESVPISELIKPSLPELAKMLKFQA